MKFDFAIIFAAAAIRLLRCFLRRFFPDRMQTPCAYIRRLFASGTISSSESKTPTL